MNKDIVFHEDEMRLLAQSDGCAVYQLKNETGDGTMTMYELFPGIVLMFNDFHMNSYLSDFHTSKDMLCIDHCREGRLEYTADKDSFSYVESGDIKIDRRVKHSGHYSFPLAHYHGITVGFALPDAQQSLKEESKSFPVDLYALQKKFCYGKYPVAFHGEPSIDKIFRELYAVPEKIKLPFFRVKVMELLLYLDVFEMPTNQMERPYFYKTQVEKIKAIQKLMTSNLEKHYTIEELAKMFDISTTPLKNCFKSVFGSPINSYMRVFRMNSAAVYLYQDKEASITDIAGRVGYDSASKFASAFNDVMGQTPLNYRKRNVPIQHNE